MKSSTGSPRLPRGAVLPPPGPAAPPAGGVAGADWTEKVGRKAELALGDDQFDPKQAVVAAERLVQDGVWGVVGHFCSSSSIPASAVYYQAGIPLVTATSTHPRLTAQGFDTVFRVSGRR